MRQIKLNFHQPRYSIWMLAGYLLLIVGLMLNVWLYVKNQKLTNQNNEFITQIQRIRQPVKKMILPVDDIQTVAEKNQIAEADVVIKQLNLPWSNLFQTLENTRDTDIDLLELSPNTQTGDVLIIGKAENLKSVFDYMERLKKSQVFSRVDLNNHEKMLQNGTQGLKFSVAAKWLPNNE